MRGARKDLSCRIYWQDFGRRALGDAFLPSPAEAAETVIALMGRVEELEAKLSSANTKAKLALQPLELAATRLANDLDAARAALRETFRD